MVDIDKLTEDLKQACIKANEQNGDYYCSEMMYADDLQEVIRKHLDPEFSWYIPHWGIHPTVFKAPEGMSPDQRIIHEIYSRVITDMLEREMTLFERFKEQGGD